MGKEQKNPTALLSQKKDFKTSPVKIVKKLTIKSESSFDSEKDDLGGLFDLELAKEPSETSMRRMIRQIVSADVADFANKLDNALLLEFYEKIESAEDRVAVTAFLDKIGRRTIEVTSSKKASAVPAMVIGAARESVFLTKAGKIISYTFYNNSPKTPICQYLAGKTISADDPDKKSYGRPPLHYNCKTVLLPNLGSFKKNPAPQKLKPSKTAKRSMW